MKRLFIVLIFIGLNSVQAQQVTQENYKSAVRFMYANYTNKTAFNLFTTVTWFKDKSGLWFVDYNVDGKTYETIDFKKKKVTTLFDHERLVNSLNAVVKNKVKSTNLSLSNIERVKNGDLQFKVAGKDFTLNLKTYQLKENKQEDKTPNNPYKSTSPDGKWIAYTKDYNLFITSTETNKEHQLSFEGKKGYEYASWYGWDDMMVGENGERPKRFYVDWSEDSKWISTGIVDTRNAEKMYLLDWSIDSLYKPKLLSYYRGSPGDTTMVHITPAFFNIKTKKEIKTALPRATHINSVNVRWTKESGKLFASYAKRGYLKQSVKLVDLNSNIARTLIEETSDTGIDNFEFRALEEKQKIIFLSERSGWRQLYITDLITNKTVSLTNGNYYINSIQYVDEKKETIYFLASGKEVGNNPYHQQLYKVNFKGKTTLLTPEKVHHIISFSKEGDYFTDNYSTIQIANKAVLRSSKKGKIIAELTTADISEATSRGYQVPEVFNLIAKDGKTTIYGAYWKPTHFDASKSYPIIDATYTGPHTQRFPKSFGGVFSEQSLAELGFIVVRVDGLGTSGRSKEFHTHSYKNMGNNLEDHLVAIKHLATKYSWIDGSKVGIFGHSAGGFDTGRAMLAFPDFYKVGVASSADHDFRMEKAWWPEMYQGWPVDDTYEQVSNITNAKNLKGKLLLTHGGIDENVNPSATFKLAEALIKADKDFDLLILPSQRHGYQGVHRTYFIKKRWNYFVEHLLETTPIWNFKWK
ncbi:MAG: DPP IV N-terminal domain-containing protein [Flavobacteriaceae bacterium]|nr:DPP IV N-terminal domain-containing protein [Flavobacteriaceae bacterium]